MGMELVVLVVVLGLLALWMWSARADIRGEEARQLVAEGATLVDVRSAAEFASGHVEGARNIPVDVIRARLSEIPKDKPVVLYCQSGMRSASAARLLKKHGYRPVYNLGGMRNW